MFVLNDTGVEKIHHLDVQRARHHVAHEEIHEARLPAATPFEDVSVPAPPEAEPDDFEPPGPPAATRFDGIVPHGPQVLVGEPVEIKAGK